MSDELKPCPFCKSGCLYETQRNGYCDYTAVMFCNRCKAIVTWEQVEEEGVNEKTSQFVREHWNTRADDAPEQPVDNAQNVGNADSYDLDTREQLEADAGELTADYAASGGVCDALYQGIIDLLDRQAAITERECREYEDELRKQHHKRVDSLTAERDKWQRVAEGRARRCMELTAARDELRERVRKLTMKTMRMEDERKRDGERWARIARQHQEDLHEIMEPREALDACGTGTMYELWRRDNAQLEALRAAQHDKPGT